MARLVHTVYMVVTCWLHNGYMVHGGHLVAPGSIVNGGSRVDGGLGQKDGLGSLLLLCLWAQAQHAVNSE